MMDIKTISNPWWYRKRFSEQTYTCRIILCMLRWDKLLEADLLSRGSAETLPNYPPEELHQIDPHGSYTTAHSAPASHVCACPTPLPTQAWAVWGGEVDGISVKFPWMLLSSWVESQPFLPVLGLRALCTLFVSCLFISFAQILIRLFIFINDL